MPSGCPASVPVKVPPEKRVSLIPRQAKRLPWNNLSTCSASEGREISIEITLGDVEFDAGSLLSRSEPVSGIPDSLLKPLTLCGAAAYDSPSVFAPLSVDSPTVSKIAPAQVPPGLSVGV